jgi:hypothetical protein
MQKLDKYFDRTYKARSYECFDFVREVWFKETGHEILRNPLVWRKRKLNTPKSPCIVLMRRVKQIHIGIWFDNQHVLNLTADGVQCLPLRIVARRYNKIGFYAW